MIELHFAFCLRYVSYSIYSSPKKLCEVMDSVLTGRYLVKVFLRVRAAILSDFFFYVSSFSIGTFD